MTLGDQNQTNIHVQQREMERFQMILLSAGKHREEMQAQASI